MTFAPPVVILDRPQLAENIGASARVMANFGLSELRLVAPRDGWPQERAWASASGADWPLNDATVFATVTDALAGLHVVHALTARPRETVLPVLAPRQAVGELVEAAGRGLRSGLLFGGERAGLETADVALAHAVVTLPVDARFRSLNLAQAVAVMAYEWGVARPEGPGVAAFKPGPVPAPADAMEGLFGHLETELEAAGFFFPPENKASMARNLRVALGRARFTEQEVRTLRGVVTALTKGRGRTLARLAGVDPRPPGRGGPLPDTEPG
jgi:tRNA/rRNA methyltransferase